MNKTYGYVRVSTREQSEDRQMAALQSYSIDQDNIFVDKISGRDFNRPSYETMIEKLQSGDTLIVKSIDRLGRNYSEILDQWRILTKDKGIDIVVIDIPLLDTRKREADLTETFVSDLMLQLLSYVAQTERDNIHQRQAEGIAAAKTKGIRFGRPPLEVPEEFYSLAEMWKMKQISSRRAAEQLGISHETFLRWVRRKL